MPRIPMGNDAGLGEARYDRSVETPELRRPVAKEAGPKREVYSRQVEQKGVAPLSQFKPALPSRSGEIIAGGLENLSRRAEQFALIKQEELRRVNEAAEKTALLVTLGDRKTAYRQNTLDIINDPALTREDKAKELQKQEDDFRAFINDVNPQYQPVVAQEVMGTIGSVKAHAQDVYLRNQQDGIKADLGRRQEQLILDAASTGDLDGTLAHFDALYGAYKSAGLTDARFADDRAKFEQAVLQNDIMGHLKTLDTKGGLASLETVNGLLGRLTAVNEDGTPQNWQRLDPATRNADIAAVLGRKNQIEADLQAQANKATDRIKSSFNVGLAYYTDALKNGDPVPAELHVNLVKQAQAMVQLEPDNPEGAMALLRLQKAERDYGPGYRAEQAAKDPLFGTGVQPLSFGDTSTPDALQAKFAANIQAGRMVKEAKSLTFVPVLRNADMEGIAKTIEQHPMNGIKLVAMLKDGLGQEGSASLTYLAGQMANSPDPSAPAAAAIIYNVAKGDRAAAQTVASGMEVLRNKAITMPKDADLRGRFDKLLGNALAESSANRGVNYQVYKTVYAALAARGNFTDGGFDKATADEAFRRTVGEVTKWNGGSVVLPEGWDENRFKDHLGSISPETVRAWGGIHGMTDEKAAEFLKDDAQLRAVSPGRYAVLYDDRHALTKQGGTFVVDVNAPLVKPLEASGWRVTSGIPEDLR